MTGQSRELEEIRSPSNDGFRALVDWAMASVVLVINLQPSGDGRTRVGSGSGFCWKSDHDQTLIITNRHVVADGSDSAAWPINPDSEYRVSFGEKGGSPHHADLVGVHPLADIAVLRATIIPRPVLLPFRQGAILPCEDVIAVGNPAGFMTSFTKGVVSGVDRENFSAPGNEPARMIQTDASINRGNSGGPLVGTDGAVVGVNAHGVPEDQDPWLVMEGNPAPNGPRAPLGASDGRQVFVEPQTALEGVNFAVPADIAEAAASAILEITEEGISVGRLGVTWYSSHWFRHDRLGSTLGRVLSGSVGVEVTEDPDPDSPAGLAGIVAGDIIVSIGDDPVDHPADLNAWAIKKSSWESESPLRFLRDQELKEVAIQGQETRITP